MTTRYDRPRRRPGAAAYARCRIRAFLNPPVTVVPAPAGLIKDHDVAVPMRDGVTLRANVYRPPGDGPFPVILSIHPYGKDKLPRRTRRGWRLSFQFRIMNQSEPYQISSETGWEAPDPVAWVARGYVVINADARGAGTSDGVGSLLSGDEARDVYDMIEWAGTQPWSNGRVGMLGVSYLAISQYKAAALRPPHLAAICPWEGFTDAYRDFMTPGGIPERGFSVVWQAMTRRAARLSVDLGAQRRLHPLRDAWWRSITPDLSGIEVPILACASFSDHNLHSQGSWRLVERAGSAERSAYTHRGGKWAVFYSDEAQRAQAAFFDRHLRELAAPAPPRIRLEVRERRDTVAAVRDEREWPLARTHWTTLHLGDDGTLGASQPPVAGTAAFRLRRQAVAFSHRFDRDTELTGPMELRLRISLSGADDANLFVGVEKWSGRQYVPFEGSYGYGRDRIADGRLRLALRHSLDALHPVRPGEIVDADIALSASSTLFRTGDELRLIIAGRYLEPFNPLFGHLPARYPPSSRGRALVHWGPDSSTLTVPVIPG
ncbi:CocE/NonD family hydrolase [Mycobacterium sp. CVI_P3]|uniref:CocE/NonD family hydrolase n=1 Tax=Mycobacterium pinniadriaticum TaxID=2994102 RepID=A0ABT3SHA2_9MYCO|nr:CocE/NonD family hydrolase [Mycobacterium pinniadriaticum]MCX2932467.1 CocE/NonD family hydrolase [Mycobacterium pinniadriaticum]MCX2938899.1 CocE/NonD family hydrolase [Mycobacterium pinniadriaticum]